MREYLAVFLLGQVRFAGQALLCHCLATNPWFWWEMLLASVGGGIQLAVFCRTHVCATRETIQCHCSAAHFLRDRRYRAVIASEIFRALAVATVCLVHVLSFAMTAAVGSRVTRRWDIAAGPGPPIGTVAHAAIRTVFVQSDMSIAMFLAAASWWNGTVVSHETTKATARAPVARIEILCLSMSRAMLGALAGWRHRAIRATETTCARARATVGFVLVSGCAMIAAVSGRVTRRRDIAAVPRPPVGTVAHAAICSIFVKSSMSIAVDIAEASWRNGTVVSSVTICTSARAAGGHIVTVRLSVSGAMLLGITRLHGVTEVPSSIMVQSVAPNVWLAVRVAAVVVVADAKIRIVDGFPGVHVRSLSRPELARLPFPRDRLAASVATPITSRVGLIARVRFWCTQCPADSLGVAPDVRFTIRIAAKVVFIKTIIGILPRCASMLIRRLRGPLLALLAIDRVVLAATVSTLTIANQLLVANVIVHRVQVEACVAFTRLFPCAAHADPIIVSSTIHRPVGAIHLVGIELAAIGVLAFLPAGNFRRHACFAEEAISVVVRTLGA